MTSEPGGGASPGLFVWVWLPGAVEPVVAGRLGSSGDHFVFAYGQSYLARHDAVSLYRPELPLRSGPIEPIGGLDLPGCLRDGSPDAWGRRVILARTFGSIGRSPAADLDELTYMLRSGSDRVGALDFQSSPVDYVPRQDTADLEDLIEAAAALDEGRPLPPGLDEALTRGTSIGGARPKVTLRDGQRSLIAKLSSSSDFYPVVKAEAVGMILARRVGLDVARVEVMRSAGHDVLLVERFDRTSVPGQRRMMVSALTILGLGEMSARYASYTDLADSIRKQFVAPTATLRELFTRMVVNVCIGNTDDHLRNHAAFWDGRELTLTPAYDLCPQVRSGETANQALDLTRTPGERASQLRLCRAAAPEFGLAETDAAEVTDGVVETIRTQWSDAADEARLTSAERAQLMGRQILNPYVFYDSA